MRIKLCVFKHFASQSTSKSLHVLLLSSPVANLTQFLQDGQSLPRYFWADRTSKQSTSSYRTAGIASLSLPIQHSSRRLVLCLTVRLEPEKHNLFWNCIKRKQKAPSWNTLFYNPLLNVSTCATPQWPSCCNSTWPSLFHLIHCIETHIGCIFMRCTAQIDRV